MKYELTGKDLPQLYKDEQDPLLHIDESWELARGDGWVARIESCGEVRLYRNNDRLHVGDVRDYYNNDKELNDAINDGELDVANNNWYEVEFFKEGNKGLEYLDIVADDCVVFSFDEALQVFDNYMKDKDFIRELKELTKKGDN